MSKLSDTENNHTPGRRGLGVARGQFLAFASYVIGRFLADRCLRMAAGLSYTSLLAIVPLTAIAFSMLAAFPVFEGVREQFQEAVFANFLPQSADAMREYFDRFVGNTSSLSAIGIVALALTAVLLLGTIEADLNSIFRVSQPRALAPRLLMFWAMLTLGPLLLGASFSLSTYFFAATEWLGVDLAGGPVGMLTGFVPTFIIIVLLALFYLTVPNRPIRWPVACLGGIVAGGLFAMLRKLFGWYVATFPTYQNIYGALSVVPIFLVWMYLSWTVVLLGAVLTAGLDEWKSNGGRPADTDLQAGPRIVAALRILALVFGASHTGRRIKRRNLLAGVGGGEGAVDRVLAMLRDAGFVDRTEADGCWVLTRDLAEISLYDLYRALQLGLNDDDLEIAGVEGWEARLREKLTALHGAQRGALDINLRKVLSDGV